MQFSKYTLKHSKWQTRKVNRDAFQNLVKRDFADRKPLEVVVRTAFYGVQSDLRRVEIFHTDRGREFKNQIIDEIISAFGIRRSLSKAGTPIDNACAESIYNIVKTEFVFGETFNDLAQLELKWFDYVNWYNNVRIHGSLAYMTPNAYGVAAL